MACSFRYVLNHFHGAENSATAQNLIVKFQSVCRRVLVTDGVFNYNLYKCINVNITRDIFRKNIIRQLPIACWLQLQVLLYTYISQRRKTPFAVILRHTWLYGTSHLPNHSLILPYQLSYGPYIWPCLPYPVFFNQ